MSYMKKSLLFHWEVWKPDLRCCSWCWHEHFQWAAAAVVLLLS